MVGHEIFLRDGTRVIVRRIRSGDLELLDQMHNRLSMQSLYFRYLRAYRPTLEEARRICQIEAFGGAGFVATTETPTPAVVGSAHYAIEERALGKTAELAIVVEDRFQRQGLGQHLFDHICLHALSHGVQEFQMYVHPENEAMARLIQRSGYPSKETLEYGVREVRMLLSPPVRTAVDRKQRQVSSHWDSTESWALAPH